MRDKTAQALLDHGEALIQAARRAGADAADVLLAQSMSLSVSHRLGKLEDIERSENRDVGLRVFVGQRQAAVSSSDLSSAQVGVLAERAVAMARLAPEDPYCGLADPAILARNIPALDLDDPHEPEATKLGELAAEAEAAALAEPKITNSEGAGASWGRMVVALATSAGFAQSYRASSHGVSCSVIASENGSMERDYEFTSARYHNELGSPAAVGREAAHRAAKRLNPRKAKSAKVPVVYDPRVSRSLLGHFAGAINGASIARGVGFLKGEMGKPVFAPGISIIDDPHLKRGHGSKPFDGEGIANPRLVFVANGILQDWVLDLASARQLKLKTNGRASRGTGGPPSPSVTNLHFEKGAISPEALIADITEGFYVVELIGMGVNGVTGDYSRGATGFWIEKGALTYPVSEVTVAGNLKDMFMALTPANDLEFRYAVNAPTVRIEGMTVAGM